jgi:hypothetical protein
MRERLHGPFSKRNARPRDLFYAAPAMSYRGKTALLATLLTLALAPPGAAQTRRRKPRATPTPAATPTATPIPVYRAAGYCLRYERDHFLVLAELGEAGKVFHIDRSTDVAVKIRTGARLRILYVETPEGPLAKRISSGPVDPTPTSGR